MVHLDITSAIDLKEAITSLCLVDISGDSKDELIVTTLKSDVRVMQVEKDGTVSEIRTLENIPPISAMDVGDVTGDSVQDLVIGALDNTMRVITLKEDDLELRCECPLGTLPTAICVTNVMGDEKAEVIVATDDRALRCYGWYEPTLDKLAHKVVEYPVMSIAPYRSKGIPHTRFVFGDESAYIFVYQYADDRLHEMYKIKTRGPVTLVATGSVTGNRLDEMIAISQKNISLFGPGSNGIEFYDNIRAPGVVSSIKIGPIIEGLSSPGQILLSQTNSLLSIFSVDGRRLVEEGTIKTRNKSADSVVAYGDVNGDGRTEVIQAAGNKLFVIAIDE